MSNAGSNHKMNHEDTKITKLHEEKHGNESKLFASLWKAAIVARTLDSVVNFCPILALLRDSSFVSFVSSWFIFFLKILSGSPQMP